MPITTEELVLNVPDVKSLVWDGETLVDWIDGGRRIQLDGSTQLPHIYYGYRFDSVTVSARGRFAVLYERLGTKAILIDNGKLLREPNRSYYYADAYEFPLGFLALPDGTEAIAHCPREYCRIDIEVAGTGECLTDSVARRPRDIFHSRLSASPNGSFLASAGWVWQPFDVACLWSVDAALSDPTTLDEAGVPLSFPDEVESAVFLDERRLAVSVGGEGETPASERSFRT